MPERVGLYGGSFNPIHLGHLMIAQAIAETARLDRVIFLPSHAPPHKSQHHMLDAAHRAAMVRLAIEGELRFACSDYDLTRTGPTYTIDTVLHFRRELGPGAELFWLIGGDSLRDLISWKRLPELVEACTLLTAIRAGFGHIDWSLFRGLIGDAGIRRLQDGMLMTPVVEISSTDIRRRLQEGKSILNLVPEPVRAYIEKNRLYTAIGKE